jgi:hypothetical protein
VPYGTVLESADDLQLRKLAHEAKLKIIQKRAREIWADDAAALADFQTLIEGDRSKLGGRRGRSDLELARIAIRYEELVDTSAKPVAQLAKELSLAVTTVRSILHKCRDRQVLTAATPGRAGGRATSKARRLIEQADEVA